MAKHTHITYKMDVMLPTSELSKAQRQDTDRLVASGSQESVKAAIASAQRWQPTNSEYEKVAVRPASPQWPLYDNIGIGNKCLGHNKLMDLHPGTCLRLYDLENTE